VTGDLELRSKAKLIEKFIEVNQPEVGSEAEIPDGFDAFWQKQRVRAIDQLGV
jgi:type I restriction enzyme R subunit